LSFITGLGIVLIPQLTKAVHENDIVAFKELISKSMDFVVMFSMPIGVGLFVCAPQLIVLFSGDEFLPATLAMQIMTSVTLLIGLSNIYGMQILTPFGKDRYLLTAVTIGTVLSLGLNFLLIPLWAENGAALANVLSELIVTVATAYFASKTVDLKYPIKPIIFQFVLYLPVVLLAHFLSMIELASILYVLVVGICMLIWFLIINIFIVKNPLALKTLSTLKEKLGYETI
jgi:O-antigen/teichoic acid export membrane protein